jgi:signal transduction histidine kinase
VTVVSLRARLLLGALLWTIGLFAIAGVIVTHLMYVYPAAPRIFHHPFTYPTAVSLIAIACMVAGLSQVRHGLRALEQLRTRLSGVHQGRDRRVEGSYPAEVQPLVDDLNALLDHRAQAVKRALAKAGDLAHGLKTPLAVLFHEAERAEASGHHEVAAAIGQQVTRMRRQVDHHLAHARAAASGATPGARCTVRESAEGLARTLLRLHDGRGLRIDLDVAADLAIRGQREDLDEMLGNLLDNACKWARTRVSVTSSATPGRIVIAVDDDGPGIAASMRERVLQRGVRADEATSGSGLGLAIVCDLAELYGGSIALTSSPAGGLRAKLELPAG